MGMDAARHVKKKKKNRNENVGGRCSPPAKMLSRETPRSKRRQRERVGKQASFFGAGELIRVSSDTRRHVLQWPRLAI